MKLKGLKKVSGATKELKGFYDPFYLQVNVDLESGEVFVNEHFSIGHNSWTEYRNGNILNCGIVCNPMTMKQVSEMVSEAIGTNNR